MKTREELTDWFKEKLSIELGVDKSKVLLDAQIESYRLDSLSSISLVQDLEEFTGAYLEPSVFNEFNNIKELIEWMLQKNEG